ncbi:MAG: tRNA(Ile)(2)-agmatinylcytidine synthase [Methanomicrobiales archaeon]|nr:tRNA(Ile)(2)-agmatinylcytidine synthase [Methanomicrobiales archaeon]
MLIGIDDTDSPGGMCTTYIGAVLARRLEGAGIHVSQADLVRLNPNVLWKTRGNAAICLECTGDLDSAFAIACHCVEELAEFSAEQTHPGVVVVRKKPGPEFYYRALRAFCTIDEARTVLDAEQARYYGYKLGRGLIGALAAVSADLSDRTFEILAYRDPARRSATRCIDRESFFRAETATFPHTWDTVDRENEVVVCVPHTPDPVLFGIRGESPAQVRLARAMIMTEPSEIEQVWVTNQGTDAHLLPGVIGELSEGMSYIVEGTVIAPACTHPGGHVELKIGNDVHTLRCMAYEPTKGFRNLVRSLNAGDRITVTGSYKGNSLNLEKFCLNAVGIQEVRDAPVCCGKRMTSAGKGKGFKCRKCGLRKPESVYTGSKTRITPGWYEVPSCARRHLAKPLCRGLPSILP